LVTLRTVKGSVILMLLVPAGVACSNTFRQRVLHFFFEIPESPDTAAGDSAPEGAPAAEPALSFSALHAEPVFASVHEPVARRECTQCHDPAQRMEARPQYMMTNCQQCHPRYFGKEVRHMPVAYRFCYSCHTPHRSVLPGLMIKALFETCMDCHPSPEELSTPAHSVADVQNCTRCHDPHFGGRMLLKETGDAP
jgi:predicted CXXCH cytochrome family protein